MRPDPRVQPRLPGVVTEPHTQPSAPVRADTRAGGVAAHRAKGAHRAEGTIWRENPREQGLIGLTDAIGWFGAHGYLVSVPLVDAQPYDLVVDDGSRLQRVQVQTTTYRTPYGVFAVLLETRGGNQSFSTWKPFDPSAAELFYVLTDDRSRYLIPTSEITSTRQINLGGKVARFRVSTADLAAPPP